LKSVFHRFVGPDIFETGGTAMNSIDMLREKLYKAIEKGDKDEMLTISQKLDIEIINYIHKPCKEATGA
jgi:hypothetical protein